MKTRIEQITPALASEWLDKHNTINRRISEPTVQSYALDMKNGRWTLTHQGIAFDTEGRLIDGQHRLWAIVFSGCTIEMMVSRDVPVSVEHKGQELKTMDAIDRNRVRTTGQQMGLCHNIKNGNVVAAALRGMCIMVDANLGNKRISTANSLFFYELYGKHVESVVDLLPNPSLRVSHITAPLGMYHKGEPEKALDFARQLSTLEGLTPAVRTLRKYLDVNRGKSAQEKGLRIVSRAIMGFHNGENLLKIQDDTRGVDFLTGMFPSFNKKIKDALTPCRNATIIKHKTKA